MDLAGGIFCPGVGYPGLEEAGIWGWPMEGGLVGQGTQRVKNNPGGGSRAEGGRGSMSLPVVLGR